MDLRTLEQRASPIFQELRTPKEISKNNIEEVPQEAGSELRESFWEMFAVEEEEEEENKQVSNYSPLPHTPVTINGNLHTALVDSGTNPSYIQEELVKKLGLTISPNTTKTSISRN
jgi:ABC-type glycerol-3-phosphate transport system substrate-binding protein